MVEIAEGTAEARLGDVAAPAAKSNSETGLNVMTTLKIEYIRVLFSLPTARHARFFLLYSVPIRFAG